MPTQKQRGFTFISLLFAKAKRSCKGFTLIELMVAISVVAVLATVGMLIYSSVQKSARISKRLQDLDALKTAIETYKSATGSYPVSATAHASVDCDSSAAALAVLVPDYMTTLPNDPSGGENNCYLYASNVTTGTASDYKIRTNNAEMTHAEYNNQQNYIDPRRDNGPADDATNCDHAVVTPNVTAWAAYTNGARCF